MRRAEGGLQAVIREGFTPALTPVATNRFRIEGAPAGFFMEFEVEAGAVTGLRLEQGPGQSDKLLRKDD